MITESRESVLGVEKGKIIHINSNIICTSLFIFVVLETGVQVFYLVLCQETVHETLPKSTHFLRVLTVEVCPNLHPVEELRYCVRTRRYEPNPIYRLVVIEVFPQKVKHQGLINLLIIFLRLLNLEHQTAPVRVGWILPGRLDFAFEKVYGIDSDNFIFDLVAK